MIDKISFSNDLLVGLTPEQREAVTSSTPRLLVRASAGSGKTHVLTLRIQRRVATGEISADHVLAMTFTRKAGDQLRDRLQKAGIRDVRAGTFHKAAMTIVQQYRADNNLKPLTIEASRRRLVHGLAEQMREAHELQIEDWQLPRLEQEIGWALSQGLNGATYGRQAQPSRRQGPLPAAQFADVLDRYVGYCRARGVLDFDLLLSEAINLLKNEPAVLQAFRYKTRSFYVDEVQDMNPLQLALLRQMAGDDPDLFCVGDPNQSIYGFNGANPQLIAEILTTWPDTVVLDLTRNHRSTANIIAVANTLLEQGASGINPAREGGSLPLVRACDTDEEEAQKIVTWLRLQHQPGSSWRSMSVLARTNAQLELVANYLEAADIPFERLGFEHSPASDLAATFEAPVRWNDNETPNAVALSTIHRAKGLEWRHVVAMGWAEGQLPNYNATSEAELSEERRLAYVALTRSEESLLITWSKGRNDPRFPDRTPSRFLGPIENVLAERAKEEAPLTGEARRAKIQAIKEELERATTQLALHSDGH
jgi:DNA helicase-2/ATP-dependent DNA helicase PcrA